MMRVHGWQSLVLGHHARPNIGQITGEGVQENMFFGVFFPFFFGYMFLGMDQYMDPRVCKTNM